ncbi:hypothetical protein [Spongiactinospora sp. TRM90649]|uniref:hypothetical protein n=1 Tax=Spongiactinospora sp. TRM90649 TaxID=3031114 RepID=UPI0023F99B1E|nr:hypothetical protein [Spongiactinospora sp. TRM90649]MDF5751836.1 hypothetical protein [Spongiactinospora sp. TRM90649]
MSMKRRDKALNDLAEAIRNVRLPDAPNIQGAFIEPHLDVDGEAALKAVIILDAPDEDGWSADFTHALRKEVNRLATGLDIDEHVYVTLFTQEDFEARKESDDSPQDNSTGAIDDALTKDQQGRP